MFKKVVLMGVMLSAGLVSAQVLGTVGDISGVAERTSKEEEAKRRLSDLLHERNKFIINHVEAAGNAGEVHLSKLRGVNVESPLLVDEMVADLTKLMGSEVTPANAYEFVDKFLEVGKRSGYILAMHFDVDEGAGVLKVTVNVPKLAKSRWVSANRELLNEYEDLLISRFSGLFVEGEALDVLNLEQKIEAVMMETPLDISAYVKPLGNGEVEVLLDVKEVISDVGRMEHAYVGMDNHGVSTFGRNQVKAGAMFVGPNKGSRVMIAGQKSDGVEMGRLAYRTPIAGVGRLAVALSKMDAKPVQRVSSSTGMESNDITANLERVLAVNGHYMVTGVLGASHRETTSKLLLDGTLISNIVDDSRRVGVTVSNESFDAESNSLSLAYVAGRYSKGSANRYEKVEFDASMRRFVDDAGSWIASARLRGQASDSELDGYNQMGLGGPYSVRAYTGLDGLGRNAAIGTLELNHKVNDNLVVGVFYDDGWAKASCACGGYTYRLKDVGVQVTGKITNELSYNVTAAKGFGGYQNRVPGRDSEANASQVWVNLSYSFK